MEEKHPSESFLSNIAYGGSFPNGDFPMHQSPACFYPPNSLHSQLSYFPPPAGNNMTPFTPMYNPPPMYPPPFVGLSTSSCTASSRQMLRMVQPDYANFYGRTMHPSPSYPPPAAFHPPPMHADEGTSTKPMLESILPTGTQVNEEIRKDTTKKNEETPQPQLTPPQEVTDANTITDDSANRNEDTPQPQLSPINEATDVKTICMTITDEDSPEISKPRPKVKQTVSCNGTNKPKQLNRKELRWMENLEKLRAYKEEFGDCIVPRGYSDDPRLASWVAEQRKQHRLMLDGKQSSITPYRVSLLNELGFTWNAQEAAWDRHKKELIAYREQHGHCHVPLNYSENPKLGLWVKEQRRHYSLLKNGKPSHMTEERAAILDTVGFCWDTHEATWLERFRELKDFKKEMGHSVVPSNYAKNPKLATWVHHQRRQLRRLHNDEPTHITKERIDMLREVGFIFCRPPKQKGASDDDSFTDNAENEENSDSSKPKNGNKRQKTNAN